MIKLSLFFLDKRDLKKTQCEIKNKILLTNFQIFMKSYILKISKNSLTK